MLARITANEEKKKSGKRTKKEQTEAELKKESNASVSASGKVTLHLPTQPLEPQKKREVKAD